MSQEVLAPPARSSLAPHGEILLPRVIAEAGDRAARRFIEFFTATIRNRNTRLAYARAVTQFFDWCDQHQIGGIVDIEPVHVAAYIEGLQQSMSKPSVKQHLAAIHMLFDWLVTGQVVATNPAHSVRGPKHVVRRGKTSVLTADEARALVPWSQCASRTTIRKASAGGCGCMRKAASATKCQRTIISKPISTPTSTLLAYAMPASLPCSVALRLFGQAD